MRYLNCKNRKTIKKELSHQFRYRIALLFFASVCFFELQAQTTIFFDNFDNSGVMGWTTGSTTGNVSWEMGSPSGGYGYYRFLWWSGPVGNPDPLTDRSPDNDVNHVFGQGLGETSVTPGVSSYYNSNNEWLVSPSINCASFVNVKLEFWRWANFENGNDSAFLEISNDGANWSRLEHSFHPQDVEWVKVEYDISAYADRQPQVFVRWRGKSNWLVRHSGWNIDDVLVSGDDISVIAWTGNQNDDWDNPDNWLHGVLPGAEDDVLLSSTSSSPVINASAVCRNLTVASGVALTVNSGASLQVNNIHIQSNASGTGILVDQGNVTVSGTATVEQFITGNVRHYYSSPIEEADITPFAQDIYIWDEVVAKNNWFKGWVAHQGVLADMQGYNIKTDVDSLVAYSGTLKTGPQSIVLSYSNGLAPEEHRGWNLVANTYPSPVDWDAPGWVKENVQDAIYIWNPETESYMSYVDGIGINGGSRYIPAMQGFFVKAAQPGTATLAMDNSVRVANTQVRFKSTGATDFLKVTIANAKGSDEAVIRFLDDATEGFDAQRDAYKKFSPNSQLPQVYTSLGVNRELAVNSLPLTAQPKEIPLFVRTGQAGSYTLSFEGVEALEYQTVLLEDTYTGTLQNLKEEPQYEFLSGTANDSRFKMLLDVDSPDMVLATREQEAEETEVQVYAVHGGIAVVSPETVEVGVYTVTGSVVHRASLSGYNEIVTPAGAYLVRIESGVKHTTEKVMVGR